MGDLHRIYCFANAVLHPSDFTLSTITMLPEAGSMISTNVDELLAGLQVAEADLSSITRIYNLVNAKNAVMDGDLAAPAFSDPGISLAMKNVSFSYPGSESTRDVITDISFSITAGQLVVIVGANGSGKSTLLKLLTRLYDRTSGELLINGQDIRKYKLSDLYEATAVLTQDHHVYPLPLTENIGLGNPAQVSNEELVRISAEKGGADAFIKTCSEGLSTQLAPLSFSSTEDTPLANKFKEFKENREISGGERQRLVAARTFMRLTSEKIKLIVADEPSSNLDPQGELELFENLRKEQNGRTMIFVTHRFGPLVKHADLILCMKDGRLAEQGNHSELIKTGGDYRKMYEIQAEAFSSAN
ncbi:P-loop containing nucleoside triphosphate hydrolase protein [Mycena rosella]|uniref:P-loop containing nucleoside triphosphate hydrolase protein n=1 Tax=Mycena rosella TaxID=1033263 RepID=A0AAD7DY77_MYCRO|nr:P-loop containing nucleoside triphosphate hydrolase protein [Mycena rosella]